MRTSLRETSSAASGTWTAPTCSAKRSAEPCLLVSSRCPAGVPAATAPRTMALTMLPAPMNPIRMKASCS